MAEDSQFHYEVERSTDELDLKLVTIKCHGRLLAESAGQLREFVRNLLDEGGYHIVVDCSDMTFVDSSGLGALVGLKVSAINKGLSKLEFVKLTPRVMELVRMTHLTDLFSK